MTNKIIDYNELIYKSTQDFVGRQWVRDAIDDFLKVNSPRYFLILGEPGSGKTAVMADLAQRRGYPHHFIGKGSQISLAGSLDWRSPIRFAESIGYQLVRDYGGWIMNWEDWGINVTQKVKDLPGLLVGAHVQNFTGTPRPVNKPKLTIEQEIQQFGHAAKIIGVYIEKFNIDVEYIVHQLLTAPLLKIGHQWPEHQVIIVIDGLDEAENYSNPSQNIIKLLPNGSLPSNIRFVLSSRPGEHLSQEFLSQTQVLWLSEDENGNRNPNIIEDARSYVRTLAKVMPIKEMLSRKKILLTDFEEKVSQASQGNFLYLYHYAQTLRNKDETLLDTEELPHGLYAIYKDFLTKIKMKEKDELWRTAYKPILGILAVARDPLMLNQISEFSNVDKEFVAGILLQLKQFLDIIGEIGDRYYSIYHLSFSEYVVSEANDDYVSRNKAEMLIANYYLQHFKNNWDKCDDYGLHHLSSHLYDLRDVKVNGIKTYCEELYTLISKSFMEKKLARYGSHKSFAADLQLAIETAQSEKPSNLVELVRGVLIHATLQILATKVPPQILGALALTGRHTEALELAVLMAKEPRIKAQILIGSALVQHEETESSKAILLQALSEGTEDTDVVVKTYTLIGLASTLARVGEFDRVLKETKTIPVNESRMNEILGVIANRLANAGEFEKSLEVVDKIEDKFRKTQSLCILAENFSRTGEKGKATDLVNRTLKGVESIKESISRVRAFGEVASTLIQIGEKEMVMHIVSSLMILKETVDNSIDKAYVMGTLAQILAEAGGEMEKVLYISEQALALVEEISDDKAKQNTLRKVSLAMILADEFEKALPVLKRTMQYYQDKLSPLVDIAYALARTGKLDAALTIPMLSPFMTPSWSVLYEVALLLSRSGEVEQALTMAEMLDNQSSQATLLIQIAEDLFFQGKRKMTGNVAERMLTMAEMITKEEEKAQALSAVALVLAAGGENVKAKDLIGKVLAIAKRRKIVGDNKESAFRTIARALVKYDKFDQATVIAEQIEDVNMKADIELSVTKAKQQAKAIEIANVVVPMIMTEEVEGALAALENMNCQYVTKGFVLSDMALALADLGKDVNSIKSIANKALAIIETETGEYITSENKEFMLKKLARAFAKAKDFDTAIMLTDKIQHRKRKSESLAEVAIFLIEAGNESKAREIAKKAYSLTESKAEGVTKGDDFVNTHTTDFLRLLEVLATPEESLISWDRSALLPAIIPSEAKTFLEKTEANLEANLHESLRAGLTIGLSDIANFLPLLMQWAQIGERERALSIWIKILMKVHLSVISIRKNPDYDFAEFFGDGSVIPSKRTTLFGHLDQGTQLIASVDRGETLWKIYQAICEVETFL